MTEKSLIKENVEKVRKEIEQASERSGFNRAVTLLAATKTVPAELINYATQELGIRDIGENRVQELLSKYNDLVLDNVNLHFIGRLQTNKVKYIVDKVCLIHSVDSMKLADEINRVAGKQGKIMDVLIEINSGNEELKGGIESEKLGDFIDYILTLPNVRIRGLMTIAPKCDSEEEYKQYFDKTYRLSVDILQKKIHNNDVILSMGMSDNYATAVLCGSTLVRVGTKIFGKRN